MRSERLFQRRSFSEEEREELDRFVDNKFKEYSRLLLKNQARQEGIVVSPEEMEGIKRELNEMRKTIERLTAKTKPKQSPLQQKGEEIYNKNRESLEKEHWGKLVAIDTDTESIIGIGKTLEEVYKQTSQSKKPLYLRRIGQQGALYKIR